MSDITKADKVYVSTSKNGDYVSAINDEDSVTFIRADLAPQWQPIETAPKDGTKIVGSYHDGFRSFKVDVFYYCIGTWWIDDYSEGDKQPTHWQPLPNPPPAT